MTSEELKKLFIRCVDDAQFELWSKSTPRVRFVYACERGTIWRFTQREWWHFLTETIRNHGNHDFLFSKVMRHRPNHITEGKDHNMSSSDVRMHCVNSVDWTIEDWTNELNRICGPADFEGLQERDGVLDFDGLKKDRHV